MIPDLQAALACEDVRLEVNGSNTIVGVINVITLPGVPFRLMKLCVFARWASGDGDFVQKVRILSPNEEEIAFTDSKFQMRSTDLHTTNIAFFTGLEFKQLGDYSVEVVLDGDLKSRFPLRVVKVQMPSGQD